MPRYINLISHYCHTFSEICNIGTQYRAPSSSGSEQTSALLFPPEIAASAYPGPEILRFRSIVALSKSAIGAQVTQRGASAADAPVPHQAKKRGGIDEVRVSDGILPAPGANLSRCRRGSTRGLALLRRGNSRGWTKRARIEPAISHACLKVRGSGLSGQHFAS